MAARHASAKSSAPQAIRTPRLVFQPDTYQAMQKGINLIANAVRPTLGPLPRLVAIDPVSRGNRQPELLDNGGLIARRILELPDHDADMGAMFLRQVLWRQHEEAGDGTATAAVLFQSVYNQGVHYIAAGGDPMRLRRYLEAGMRVVLDQLETMTTPLAGRESLAQLALSVCHDEPLAEALGEIFDIIGEHGLLEIRSGHGRGTACEFIEGAYFKVDMATLAQRSVELADAALFISDLDLEDPQHLVHLIALAYARQKKALVIIANHTSEKVIGLLASVSQNPERFQAMVVKTPIEIMGQSATLDDIAVLCGGSVFLRATGDTVEAAKVGDLGSARRVWADAEYFGIVGGKGSPRVLRNHVVMLRKAFDQTQDLHVRKKLRERIGKLLGGAAILQVGGSTDLEIKARKERAERTADAIRGALARGYLAGGGAALLACRPTPGKLMKHAGNLDEQMAYRILIRALEEPTRIIVENAGYEAEPIVRQIKDTGAGFDVRCGKIVDMTGAGIIDSASVVLTGVREAIASAALALTVEVLVHHRKPESSANP
jgi:chaperonin GroEL